MVEVNKKGGIAVKKVEINLDEFLKVQESLRKEYIESRLKAAGFNQDGYIVGCVDTEKMIYIYLQD
jgi:uncharacterized DUF497 family protein